MSSNDWEGVSVTTDVGDAAEACCRGIEGVVSGHKLSENCFRQLLVEMGSDLDKIESPGSAMTALHELAYLVFKYIEYNEKQKVGR
jgi:hypothetical protein